MRFMVMVKATEDSEAGVMPSEELLTEMTNYNEQLADAGILLAGEGLHPSSKGARVHFSGKNRTVTDGPFAETKERLGGYYLVEADSIEDAAELAAKIPSARLGGSVEVRQVVEM